jgi:hypothetical protein
MKKSVHMLALTALIFGSTLFSCKTNSEKEADATQNVTEAKEDLKETKDENTNDAATKANDAEWQTYKSESLATIAKNEVRIVELRKARQKPGTTFDASYSKNIDELATKNEALRVRINNYENNQTDWESFKREFSSDMDDLGNAFNNLTVNNKK